MNDKKSSGRKDERTRNWSFIIYPDSAPKNWREIIDDEHIQWIESPLHGELDPDDSENKPHWHVMLLYEGNKSFAQIEEITKRLNCTIPQKVGSVKGLVRYMAHLDNPEKKQYKTSDIIGHGGVDLAELLKPTSSTRYVLIKEMAQYVKDNQITEYNELFYYAMEQRFDDWFPLLCDSATYAMSALIKSNRYSFDNSEKIVKVDKETGEIKD